VHGAEGVKKIMDGCGKARKRISAFKGQGEDEELKGELYHSLARGEGKCPPG